MEAQLQEVSRKMWHPGPVPRGLTHSSSEGSEGKSLWPPGLPLTPQAGWALPPPQGESEVNAASKSCP